MNNKVTPLIDRYLAKVDKSGGPDACWPWTGSLNKGYGQIGAGPCPPGVARNNRSQTELGRLYGVTQAQISSIVLRKSWSHVT